MPVTLLEIKDGATHSSPLANRILKNYRHLRKWAKKAETDCFRIYDRDIKEFPLAIDYYAGRFCMHYFFFREDDTLRLDRLMQEVNAILHTIFGVSEEMIFWRTRQRRKKLEQYEKKQWENDFFTVFEYGTQFKINLVNYLDTGLFLDHRETRKLIASLSQGKRLLNLFAYTCAFSVHAAKAGATYTKSIDLSNTYTSWGKENFLLNSLNLKENEIIRDDCLNFLDSEIKSDRLYDLIVIDPPTISRSKKMNDFFDIQKDHTQILLKSLKLLSEKGMIFFSTNSRKFNLEISHFLDCEIINISQKTIPIDFRNQKIHQCWQIKKK